MAHCCTAACSALSTSGRWLCAICLSATVMHGTDCRSHMASRAGAVFADRRLAWPRGKTRTRSIGSASSPTPKSCDSGRWTMWGNGLGTDSAIGSAQTAHSHPERTDSLELFVAMSEHRAQTMHSCQPVRARSARTTARITFPSSDRRRGPKTLRLCGRWDIVHIRLASTT